MSQGLVSTVPSSLPPWSDVFGPLWTSLSTGKLLDPNKTDLAHVAKVAIALATDASVASVSFVRISSPSTSPPTLTVKAFSEFERRHGTLEDALKTSFGEQPINELLKFPALDEKVSSGIYTSMREALHLGTNEHHSEDSTLLYATLALNIRLVMGYHLMTFTDPSREQTRNRTWRLIELARHAVPIAKTDDDRWIFVRG